MSENYYKTLIKDIIENNDKEEAIKIIANKLNEKQISNENEMLTNLDKDKEIERLNKEILGLNNCIIEFHSEFCNKQAEINRLNNIINTMLDFNFFKEECPLNFGYNKKCDEEKAQDVFYEDDYCEENCNNDYKKCWLKYFERLQELKGSDKE